MTTPFDLPIGQHWDDTWRLWLETTTDEPEKADNAEPEYLQGLTFGESHGNY